MIEMNEPTALAWFIFLVSLLMAIVLFDAIRLGEFKTGNKVIGKRGRIAKRQTTADLPSLARLAKKVGRKRAA